MADSAAAKLFNFLGYGRPSAPIWFIGIEEGLGGAMTGDEPRKNLRARASFEPIMDLRKAHLKLFENGNPIDISNPKREGSRMVWRWMSRLVRAYFGAADWMDLKKADKYIGVCVADLDHRTPRLGCKDERGQTFLTELSPIPSAKAATRRWIMQELSVEKPELLELERHRWNKLRDLLKTNAPRLVICFGRALRHQERYRQLLEIPEWQRLTDKIGKAAELPYFLVPFLGRGHMTGEIARSLVECEEFRNCRQ